jgi:hypothetical protein
MRTVVTVLAGVLAVRTTRNVLRQNRHRRRFVTLP